ncbi:kinase-like protein [Hesseltinella vesiculosa]|uniref:Kinase-like protein n=1 Tax=Hesseltinella vesiculosa TaxID=101127 RepID=A0A1X2G6Q8_9FUNG|nr:kinase-like protein [Hesseltinella vesiculosa]
MTLPRPQLRLHLAKRKPESPKPCERDDKDPMKPELDLVNLQKLTIMVLRSLGVTMALEELPAVDIDESFPTDAEQVLPPTAMQLITKMILGTSGDKDVAQTVGSQICNGDLVALQRMIVAALKTKNIVIHTIQSSSCNGNGTTPAPTATQANIARASGPVKQGNKTIYDLSTATYHTPNHVTRLFLRLYRFILNTLLSTPHCWPFIQPVPTSAVFYHQEVRYPMDLSTIEHNIWSGLYTRFAKFEQDMQLIWKNAKAFHGSVGTIPKHAENLELLFYKVVLDIKKQVGKSGTTDFRFDVSDSLPEEGDFAYPPMSQVFSKQTIVYGIAAMSPFEDKAKKPKGLTNDKQLYLQLNGPFFQALEEMKQDPFGNHPPVPRFYIAKNRTLLRQVRAHGVLAIFYNTRTTRVRSKHYKIITDVVLTYPASTLHDIDQTDDFAARGWMHLRPLRLIEQLEFHVNEVIERDYFRRMYATSKLMITDDPPHHHHQHHHQPHGFPQPYQQPAPPAPPATSAKLLQSNASKLETKRMLKKMPGHPKTASPVFKKEPHRSSTSSPLSTPEDRQPSSTLSPDSFASTPQSPLQPLKSSPMAISPSNKPESEMLHEVWQRLLERCETKGAHIVNVQQKYEGLHWAAPDSEGFFKQVYFLQDVVVQTFRQMTMHQRITEVACLMKLRNLPHMAQLCEILHNDNGDIVGLSMERYQTTLKQYTHAHSHHRLSAYQKYHVIHQMLVCMKTIHAAGLAHRDLSEVNIMVNNVEGELEDGSSNICLYLIDFGKAVFCEKADVQQWFVDVPRGLGEYDGDIVPETKEELDEWCDKLPWIKAKPDHGYRMYRSIQTLPKSRTDTQVLKHLIHPKAEDMYSIGVMIWKIFTETEPWRGILDTDLQGLRYIAEDDYRIQRALEHEVQGELSRKLLLMLLKRNPQDRATADQLLNWIEQEDVHTGLLSEWKMYSSETRATRKSKTMYGFDESDTFTSTAKRPSKKSKAKVRKNGTAASSTTASSATSDMMQTD